MLSSEDAGERLLPHPRFPVRTGLGIAAMDVSIMSDPYRDWQGEGEGEVVTD